MVGIFLLLFSRRDEALRGEEEAADAPRPAHRLQGRTSRSVAARPARAVRRLLCKVALLPTASLSSWKEPPLISQRGGASLSLPGTGVATHLGSYEGHLSLLHLCVCSVILKYRYEFVGICFTHWVIIHYINYNTIYLFCSRFVL